MRLWLCIGDKKKNIPACIYCNQSKGVRVGAWGKRSEVLMVDCTKQLKMITKYITECGYYNNNTLKEYLK